MAKQAKAQPPTGANGIGAGTRAAQAASHASRRAPPRAPAAPAGAHDEARSLGALRECVSQSLLAAQQSADLLLHMQRLDAQAAAAWVQSLAQAAREAEKATDLTTLMAVPAQVWARQLDLCMRRLSEGSQHLLEAELQWADRARTQARALGLPWWAPGGDEGEKGEQDKVGNGASGRPAEATEPTSPLVSLNQMQQAWLDLSQRWMSSIGPLGGGAAH